jgi:hypothetical protein
MSLKRLEPRWQPTDDLLMAKIGDDNKVEWVKMDTRIQRCDRPGRKPEVSLMANYLLMAQCREIDVASRRAISEDGFDFSKFADSLLSQRNQ